MPESWGKYEIQEKLGQGAMGIVYKAWDRSLNRTVALKTMASSLTGDAELKQRFDREAQAAAQLQHPNIVTIYELGEHQEQVFISMEFIPGKSLKELDKEALSLERKLDAMSQICRALDYAHQFGIVHRDVKPGNILLTDDGVVKILDFGIAHLATSDLTQTGAALGTPEYMSPELIQGHKIDHRTDIFSCGIVFYELLTGQKPFFDQTLPNLLYNIITRDPPPVSKLLPEAPALVDKIVSRMLKKAPEDRYQSLAEVMDELNDLRSELFLQKAQDVQKLRTLATSLQETYEKASSEGEAAAAMLESEFGTRLAEGRSTVRTVSNPSDPSVTVEAITQGIELLEDLNREVEEFVAGPLRRRIEEAVELFSRLEEAIRDLRLEEAAGMLERLEEIGHEPELVRRWRSHYEEVLEEVARRELQARIETYLREARESVERNELRSALGKVEEALALDDSAEEARELRDRIREEIRVAEEGRRKKPRPAKSGKEAGATTVETPSAEKAARKAPGSKLLEKIVDDFFLEARQKLGVGDEEGCRQSLRRILELSPNHSGARELLRRLDREEAEEVTLFVEDTAPPEPVARRPGAELPKDFPEGVSDQEAAPPVGPEVPEDAVSEVPEVPTERSGSTAAGSRQLLIVAAVPAVVVLVGGLAVAGLAYFLLTGGADGPDETERQQILILSRKIEESLEYGAYKAPAVLPALLDDIEVLVRVSGDQEAAAGFRSTIRDYYREEAERLEGEGDSENALFHYRVLVELLNDEHVGEKVRTLETRLEEERTREEAELTRKEAERRRAQAEAARRAQPQEPAPEPEAPPEPSASPLGTSLKTVDPLPPVASRRPEAEGPLVVEPQVLEKVQPHYPVEAQQAGISGTVSLLLNIDEKGRVTEARVLKGHPVLAEAAVAAVNQWKFSPGRLRDRPTPSRFGVDINFAPLSAHSFPARHRHPQLMRGGEGYCSGNLVLDRQILRYSAERGDHAWTFSLGALQVIEFHDAEIHLSLPSGSTFTFNFESSQDAATLRGILTDLYGLKAETTADGYRFQLR